MVMVCSLLACISSIICFRIYFSSGKIIKDRLLQTQEDFNQVMKENRSLKGSLAMAKNPKLPDDLDASNLGDVALNLIPKKYHKIARPLIPKLEEYIANNPEKLEQVLNQIKGVNQDAKREQQTDSETIQSL
tara:strand:+ start:221 stop:616 length:396 start_codon:yes stop_codon:yes gene_type:complete